MENTSKNGIKNVLYELGPRVTKLRKDEGIKNQAEMADKLGMSKSTYAKIETGEACTLDNFLQIVSHFKVSADHLLYGTEKHVSNIQRRTGLSPYAVKQLCRMHDKRIQEKENKDFWSYIEKCNRETFIDSGLEGEELEAAVKNRMEELHGLGHHTEEPKVSPLEFEQSGTYRDDTFIAWVSKLIEDDEMWNMSADMYYLEEHFKEQIEARENGEDYDFDDLKAQREVLKARIIGKSWDMLCGVLENLYPCD